MLFLTVFLGNFTFTYLFLAISGKFEIVLILKGVSFPFSFCTHNAQKQKYPIFSLLSLFFYVTKNNNTKLQEYIDFHILFSRLPPYMNCTIKLTI
jgi:hypothetical protein